MPARKFRLPFREFPRNSRRVSSPHILIKFSKNIVSQNRFAIVVGATLEKRSVRRHALKRKIGAILERWPECGTDFICILLKKMPDDSPAILLEELEALESKIFAK